MYTNILEIILNPDISNILPQGTKSSQRGEAATKQKIAASSE